jgi:hypothetical protein
VNTLEIIILVLVVVVIALAIGGYVASGRRQRVDRRTLDAELEAANAALAVAHLDDKGWERSLLEDAAKAAFAERSAAQVRELQLVQVVDRPGTEDDQAVFRVITDHGSEYLHLDRHGDAWVAK